MLRLFKKSSFQILFFCLLASCTHFVYQNFTAFDNEPLHIQTLALFNQEKNPPEPFKPWNGDWYFRRQRLSLIDDVLTETKPHLILFSEVMTKNSSDSDIAILRTRSLSHQDVLNSLVRQHPFTGESEYLAISFGVPIQFSDTHRMFFTHHLDREGFVMQILLQHENQDFVVFNVQMSEKSDKKISFAELSKLIGSALTEQGLCKKRIVLAGSFLGSGADPDYLTFLKEWDLKDSALFCDVVTKCYTQTPENKIFSKTHGEVYPQRTNRIITHQDSIIHSSQRTLNQPQRDPHEVGKPFGLSELWPTEKYGWSTHLTLPRCH